jgi:diguanylate cyclase (GGDEF)-like protein
MNAVPAAGLAKAESDAPDYLKQIQAAHTEVAALYEMAQTFSASLDVRDVVTLTVNRIERMIPFTTCVVYLKQAGDESALAAYAFGQNSEKIRGRSLAAGHGIAGWVIINGRPMSNTDPMLDLADFVGLNESSYRTAAVYPLKNGEDAMGALALYSSELGSYTSDCLHLLESVARFASTALEHALLYEQTKTNAQTDSMTGLPNGRALYARFDQELAEAKEQSAMMSVLSFNLSGMRAVNDAYGYRAGDRMLAAVAHRLRAAIDESHLLSRVAGDEFICLLRGFSREEAAEIGRRAQEEISRLTLELRPGQRARVALSYGVAECPTDGRSIDELLNRAAVAARENNSAHIQESPDSRMQPYSYSRKPHNSSIAVT